MLNCLTVVSDLADVKKRSVIDHLNQFTVLVGLLLFEPLQDLGCPTILFLCPEYQRHL